MSSPLSESSITQRSSIREDLRGSSKQTEELNKKAWLTDSLTWLPKSFFNLFCEFPPMSANAFSSSPEFIWRPEGRQAAEGVCQCKSMWNFRVKLQLPGTTLPWKPQNGSQLQPTSPTCQLSIREAASVPGHEAFHPFIKDLTRWIQLKDTLDQLPRQKKRHQKLWPESGQNERWEDKHSQHWMLKPARFDDITFCQAAFVVGHLNTLWVQPHDGKSMMTWQSSTTCYFYHPGEFSFVSQGAHSWKSPVLQPKPAILHQTLLRPAGVWQPLCFEVLPQAVGTADITHVACSLISNACEAQWCGK